MCVYTYIYIYRSYMQSRATICARRVQVYISAFVRESQGYYLCVISARMYTYIHMHYFARITHRY